MTLELPPALAATTHLAQRGTITAEAWARDKLICRIIASQTSNA